MDANQKSLLRRALVDADIEGLIRMGAPDDEYDKEAEMIGIFIDEHHEATKRIEDDESPEHFRHAVADIIFGVFALQFGRDMAEKISREEIAKLAETISAIR